MRWPCGYVRRILRNAALAVLACAASVQAVPQSGSAPTGSTSIPGAATLEDIQRLRDALVGRTDLTDAAKQELLNLYDATLESLRQTAALAEDDARFVRERQSAPAELEAARAEAAPPTDAAIVAPADAQPADLRTARDQADATLSQAQQRVADLDKEQSGRAARRTEIPAQLARAEQDLDQARQASIVVDSQTRTVASAELTAARPLELRTRIARLEQLQSTLKSELAGYDARTELNQLQRDRAARRLAGPFCGRPR